MSPEKRAAAVTVAVVALTLMVRVLGISLVLPVFAPYGLTLTDDLVVVGLAFGAYGLTMALFQVPMGALSDRWGRKRVILLGLVLFAAGSAGAAVAPNAWLLVLARLVQGAGAVNGAALALVGDVVSEERRTVAMAVVGAAIGGGFVLGLILGPALEPMMGVPGLFLLTAALAVALTGLSAAALPNRPPTPSPEGHRVLAGLRDPATLRLGGAGFGLNFAQNAVLFALPLATVGLFEPTWFGDHRRALSVMALLGGLVMFATSRAVDKGHGRAVLAAGFALVAFAPLALLHVPAPWTVFGAGVAFFAAHSTLAATLPSVASRLAATHERGATLGAFNLAQYLGTFAGGLLGGLLWGHGPALALAVAAVGLGAVALVRRIAVPPRRRRAADESLQSPPELTNL